MQRHSTQDDAFRRHPRRPAKQAAASRFAGIEEEPWDPQVPPETWTREERRGAVALRWIRVLLAVTVLGAAAALGVALWRVYLFA